MRKRNKKGFTLVELMVVAVIVAILAAVAVPLMSANKKRAMATEAEAAMGTVRTALRTLYAQTSAYNRDLDDGTLTAPLAPTALPGIESGDLNGKYWQEGYYSITAIAAGSYTITATGASGSPVEGVTLTLDEAGAWTRAGL